MSLRIGNRGPLACTDSFQKTYDIAAKGGVMKKCGPGQLATKGNQERKV